MCLKTPFGLEADMWGEGLDKPVGNNGIQKQKLNEEEWASESDRIEFKSSYHPTGA